MQTGIAAATHATLDTEQLISHTRTALVDTITCIQGSKGELIPVSELLSKIHDTLDNAVSKQAGNIPFTLV